MNVVVVGNFHVNSINMVCDFQHEGVWFDYMTGEEITISNTAESFSFEPGEYHIYIDIPLETPDIYDPLSIGNNNPTLNSGTSTLLSYPNPCTTTLLVELPHEIEGVVSYEIFDSVGKIVLSEISNTEGLQINTGSWTPGIYSISITVEAHSRTTHYSSTIQKL
jgi:hypothetical protein